MNNPLSHYESVETASRDMLAAARVQDWDALVLAERRCAASIALLKASDAEVRLSTELRRRKSEIIHRVLAHDAEIRRLVDPHMRQLERLIGASGTQRRVEAAYST